MILGTPNFPGLEAVAGGIMQAGTKLPVPLLQGCTRTFICLSLTGAELPLTFIRLVPGKRRRCVSVGPEGPKKVSASLAPFTSSKNQARHHSSDVAGKGELRPPEVWPAESAPSPFMARLDLSALMRIQKPGGENGCNKTVPQKPCLIGGIRECVGPVLLVPPAGPGPGHISAFSAQSYVEVFSATVPLQG